MNKKPQNKQKYLTKTRQTRNEKMSSTIYSMTKPLVLFSPWNMDTASIECRVILPLKKNPTNKPIKENTHPTKSKANKQTKKPHTTYTKQAKKDKKPTPNPIENKQRDYPLLHLQIWEEKLFVADH